MLRLNRIWLLMVILGGCSSASGPEARWTVGLSVLNTTNPFFKEIADTMTEEGAKHGYRVITVSGDDDVVKQDKQLADFIVKKVDAIVLSPCDSKSIGQAIQKANTAGIPVFTVDIGCLAPGAKVVTHIATDNYAGGKQAAVAMIEALGPAGGRIAVLDHRMVESCQLRVKGFKEVLDEHNQKPGTGRIDIVAELPSGGSKDQGYKSAEDILQAHGNLAGIFAINDPSALGARAALEKAGRARRVKIIGFDGQPEGKRAIRDGNIYADPVQYPDKIGRTAAATIARYFDGEEVPAEILIPTGLYRQADGMKDSTLD
ncbi:MAG: substrate-binding domain-containing protein [Planctomycetes bacterium]|nr:substrate-binding domain-containing protein [Planctomycetota bacterium]